MQSPGLLLDLVLTSDPRLLSVVRAAVERLTEVTGFSPVECRSITRAVDEALANVIRHAYQGQPGQRIELSCKRITVSVEDQQRDALEIDLLDQGIAFDRDKLTARSLDEVKPGGLGLHFIRDSMDVMEHSRVNGTNRLRLVKYLHENQTTRTNRGE